MVQTYPDLDLSDYRAFAFWRDPQDWFLSALDYMTRKSATSTKVGIWHKNMSPRAFWESDTNMKRQASTIASRFDAPDDIQDIELFSFHDFNNEIIRLFKELEVDVTPKMIEDNTILAKGFGDKRVLTDKDKAQIRKYWWEDYHYLEYKGIELPK